MKTEIIRREKRTAEMPKINQPWCQPAEPTQPSEPSEEAVMVETLQLLKAQVPKLPWKFLVNCQNKSMQLRAVSHDTVMDFQRWGMGGARMRLLEKGLMEDAETFARPAEGREHHKKWHQEIDHPITRFIEAAVNNAGELTEALAKERARVRELQSELVWWATGPKHAGDCVFTDKSDEGCYRCEEAERDRLPNFAKLLEVGQ